jgi:hypothetical protein
MDTSRVIRITTWSPEGVKPCCPAGNLLFKKFNRPCVRAARCEALANAVFGLVSKGVVQCCHHTDSIS